MDARRRAFEETLADWRAEMRSARHPLRKAAIIGQCAAALLRVAVIGAGSWRWPGRPSGLGSDLFYAWRRLRSTPGFTIVAVLTLALGIGANTALFSVVNSLVLRSLPIPALDDMVLIGTASGDDPSRLRGLTDAAFRDLETAQLDAFRSVAAVGIIHGALSAEGRADVFVAEAVSGNYFQTVGVQPLLGRVLTPADDRASAGGEVVLSERMWRRLFNGDPAVIGQIVRLTGKPLTLIGVVPDSFHGLWLPTLLSMDAWVPLRDAATLDAAALPPGQAMTHRVFGRLRSGVAPAIAAGQLGSMRIRQGPSQDEAALQLRPARAGIVPDEFARVGAALGLAVIGLSGLVLLIACANLTNLLLARATNRSVEIAIRIAAGASRGRIAQLLAIETSLVTAAAGVVGTLVALSVVRAFAAIPLPQLDGVSVHYDPAIDVPVFAYSLILAVVAAFAVGSVPAWRASRTEPVRVFANAGGAGGSTSRAGRLRSMLVASQVAASTVLLLAAGLFVRSALAGIAYDPGFDIAHTAIAHVNLTYHGYDEARGRTYFRRLIQTANDTSGIAKAVLASGVPAERGAVGVDLLAEGQSPIASKFGPTGYFSYFLRVTPGYFEVLGIAVKRGRDFNGSDVKGATPVVVVSESLATKLWPGQDPVGRRLSLLKNHLPLEVVGVVADTDRSGAAPSTWRYAFVPFEQDYSPRMALVARGPGDAVALLDPLRAAARTADPEVAVFDVRSVAEQVAIWLVPLRVAAVVLAALGVLGAAIALLGMYGVTAYVVSLRTREFGILKALGASEGHVYASVLKQGARTLAAGVAVGLAGAYVASGLLEHLLYGIRPHDLVTFVAVPAALGLVGVAASIVPARWAARIDPNVALRQL